MAATITSTRHDWLTPASALLGSDALAHVVTVNPDGSPQVSVVWCAVHGDAVSFVTERATAKVRNLRRDPRVILSIEDEERNARGHQRHLIIDGHATISEGCDRHLLDELFRIYGGASDHPLRTSDTTVTVSIDVRRIAGSGPWVGPRV